MHAMDRSRDWKSPSLRALFAASLLIAVAGVAQADGLLELLERLERQFDVYTLTDGYALVPRQGVERPLLELRAGRVAVAGSPLESKALEELVGRSQSAEIRALAAYTARAATLRRARRAAKQPVPVPKQSEPAVRRNRGREGSWKGRPTGSRVRMLGGVRVEEGEIADEAVSILGDVTIRGPVRGDVVAVVGSVRVSAPVAGDVTAVGGSVDLERGAEVAGRVVAVGGAVHRSHGVTVRGGISEIDVAKPLRWLGGGPGSAAWIGHISRGWPWWHHRDFNLGLGLFGRLVNAFLLVVITLLLLVLGSGLTERLAARVRTAPLHAVAVGLAVQVVTLPLLALACLVLLVSIIGIPLLLLVPVALAALFLAMLVGYAGTAAAFGRWIAERLGRRGDGPLVIATLGVAGIQGVSLLGEFMDGWFWPLGLLGLLLLAIGFVVRYVAWTLGVGAVVLTLFTRRR